MLWGISGTGRGRFEAHTYDTIKVVNHVHFSHDAWGFFFRWPLIPYVITTNRSVLGKGRRFDICTDLV